ncbi:MAG: hypothetical protein L3K26_03610 [Candidatus Hydrogenedentes bacterium]|nr:hypothetical protein [Candidatus Hydrogenedentota bacterium]
MATHLVSEVIGNWTSTPNLPYSHPVAREKMDADPESVEEHQGADCDNYVEGSWVHRGLLVAIPFEFDHKGRIIP